ncbi:MAG: sel1 repeat family protein, partial [Clostridia bacterium]|nr:sel1 repeat family protein [Clostridia bacterium]
QATGKGEEAESQQQEQALAPVSSAAAEDGTLDAAVLARAEKGEAEAIMAVADYYWYGNEDKNIAPDYKKAKEWFERPEMKENNTALVALGIGYYEGYFDENGQPDYQKAFDYYTAAAKRGDEIAMNNLGAGYTKGYFTEDGQPDHTEARDWYVAAAKLEYKKSMYNLGKGYDKGYYTDGKPDVKNAEKWYTEAADRGHGLAAEKLVAYYLSGKTDENGQVLVEKDPEKALHYLNVAYEDNHRCNYVLSWLGWYHAGNSGVLAADYPKAVGFYEEAAANGDTYSMEQLAKIYGEGQLGSPDMGKAIEWYEKAAAADSAYAAENLAELYLKGKTDENGQALVEKDDEKALMFFQMAAEQGDAYSMEQLAKIYGEGQLGSPDMGKAIEWYEKAAAADSAYAAEKLAELYLKGKTDENGQALVETDDEKALEYLEKAYQLNPGSSFAQVWLGWYYAGNSDVLAADDAKALMFFQMAAEQGDDFAMYQLGEMYEGGQAGKQDMQQALAWYEKAAQSGQINAAEKLAELYHKGKTDENGQVLVEKDDEKALEYLKKAYEINPDGLYAQVWLGWFYAGNSEVLEADYEKAVAFYEAAAGQGDAYSMCQLGLINKNGQYGQPDFATMEKWFGQAAELGNKQAAHELCYMYTQDLTDENGHVLAVYDEEKAFHALERAYMLGDDDRYVLSFLGWFYDGNSDAAQREPEKAAACFEAAAQQGDGYSMVRLGKLYLNDKTDLFDPDKAKTWLEKALETDSREEAQKLLDGMALLTEE